MATGINALLLAFSLSFVDMMTRREKLLLKPWQERSYNNHRRKVKSALPAIDASPPPTREHVCYKLKKKHTEYERTARIEKENFRLLQRMGSIMRINRLDNHWVTPPPSFLQRVGIYYQPTKHTPALQYISSESSTPQDLTIRQKHCLACNPQNLKFIQAEITERVPWEQPKTYSRIDNYPLKTAPATKMTATANRSTKINQLHDVDTQCITLIGTDLHLAVNFPVDTAVQLVSKKTNNEYCSCKAITLN